MFYCFCVHIHFLLVPTCCFLLLLCLQFLCFYLFRKCNIHYLLLDWVCLWPWIGNGANESESFLDPMDRVWAKFWVALAAKADDARLRLLQRYPRPGRRAFLSF